MRVLVQAHTALFLNKKKGLFRSLEQPHKCFYTCRINSP